MDTRTATLTLLATTFLLTGCKSNTTPPTEATNTPAPAPAPLNPATLGSVEGIVHLTGKPPARISIDMSADPACAMAPGQNMTEQYIVSNGHLANVFLYIKSGIAPSKAPANTAPVVLDQKGCRYIPHVIALQQGASVEFRNSDPAMHNIHMVSTLGGNTILDLSQGPGATPTTHQFNSPEQMIPVRCNNHPWMQAFVNVADSPYFAVSATDGTFRITGLPAGTYTLAAIHEKLGEQDIQITVPARGVAKPEITFTMH
jgi:plastocyanin